MLSLTLLTSSCAATFGTPGHQTYRQRKTDKAVGLTIVTVGAIIIGLVVANNYNPGR